MNSTCGVSPTRCSARMRSAANMKLPFSTATTSRSLGSVSATARASASLRAAILPSSNRTRTRGVPAINNPDLTGFGRDGLTLETRSEADKNLPAFGRRRGEARPEGRRLARPQCLARSLARPGVKRLAVGAPHGEFEGRHLRLVPADIDDLALDDQERLGPGGLEP